MAQDRDTARPLQPTGVRELPRQYWIRFKLISSCSRPQRLTLPCRNFHAGGSRSRLFGQDVAAKRVRTHVARSSSSTHRRQARRLPVHLKLSPLQATSGRSPDRKTWVETVQLILRACERHGIFDRLYTDNGSAVAGHPVAGGNVHRFRNAGRTTERVQPLGVCHHPRIHLHLALPGNVRAKIAGRTSAALSRVIDDRPKMDGAHAGHTPGAAPSADVTPVHIARS
ncbi:hypothetical protein PARU111607_17860 [Palleronia rufa]